MIDPILFVPGFFMFGSIRKVADAQPQWKPTLNDARELEAGMKQFTQTEREFKASDWQAKADRTFTKKLYPFEQYCESMEWIAFLENGEIIVKNEFQWRRAGQTYELLKWRQSKDMEQLFHANPEEREAYEAKLDGVKKDIREMLHGKLIPTAPIEN